MGEIAVYDEIGIGGMSAACFADRLAGISGDVTLHINSPGGDVFDGIAMYSALQHRAGLVRVVVDSLAASIASVVAMAASPGHLVMAPSAVLMIHDAHAVGMCGTEADMMAMAGRLGKMSDVIAGIYAARSRKPASVWREAMRAETWYTPGEAVAAGLADSVEPDWPAVAASLRSVLRSPALV